MGGLSTTSASEPGGSTGPRAVFLEKVEAAVQLDEVQALMEELFGEADRARGLPSTIAWLCEEVGELAQAVRKGSPAEQLHELGDVLAWTASLANQLGLSLEDAMQRYRDLTPDLTPGPTTDPVTR